MDLARGGWGGLCAAAEKRAKQAYEEDCEVEGCAQRPNIFAYRVVCCAASEMRGFFPFTPFMVRMTRSLHPAVGEGGARRMFG